MDKLWAPWRSPYIKSFEKKEKPGCVFCRALSNFKKKKDCQVIEVSEHAFSVLNIYPYNNGHVMVMPIRHIGDFQQLKPAELVDLMLLVQKTQATLKRVLKPDAFNIGLNLGREAGAGIRKHLHFHIVPRWNGDTNFMPLFSGTKVISQSLAELRKRLLNDIQSQSQKRNRRKRS